VSNFTNNTGSAGASGTLTIKKIRDMMDALPPDLPAPRYDLYPHDLPDNNLMYTINRSGNPSLYIGQDISRHMLIVPRSRMMAIYHDLRNAGIDVMLEPRVAEPTTPPGDGT
jgi:hypothetical protein